MGESAGRTRTVHVVALGGTVASLVDGRNGYSARLGADALVPRGAIPDGIAVECADLACEQSYALGFDTARALVTRLAGALDAPGAAGAVVAMGTAALQELAYFCDLTLATPKPVVFTGAMYPASDPGPDGPHNLADAIRLAAEPAARERGVLVCFAGEIHAARDVMKLHKAGPAPYRSTGGPIGQLDAGGVIFYRQVTGRTTLALPTRPLPRVEVIKAVMDMDDLLLRAALDAGAAGIVLEGFPGVGGVPPALLPAVRDAIGRGTVVALAARSPFGRITPIASGRSGPRVLDRMGVLIGGDLPPEKLRLLLALAIANGKASPEIRELLRSVSRAGEIP